MAIPIACQNCHQAYNVDDKLAGKKVKCKGCGALIRVPGGETPTEGTIRECPACGTHVPPENRLCPHCGFNIQTGQKETLLLQDDPDALRARRNRKWTRRAGSPLLASLDSLAKLVLLLALIAGIVMAVIHVCRSAAGFSFDAILPMLVVLAAIAGLMAPLAAFAVNLTVRAMKLPPRDDTYVRLVLCMLLPLSLALLAGWPEFAGWSWVDSLGWPLAVLLLLYLLRAEVLEWCASVLAAAVAAALSLIVVVMAGAAVNDITGGLYGDMLPPGPWTGLATGHSPQPPPQASANSPHSGPAEASPSTATGTTSPSSAGAGAPGTSDAQAATRVASTQVVTTAPAVETQTAPLRVTSPFFAEVIDGTDFADASAVVVPATPGDWMLSLRNVDNNVEVDRWSLKPLKKLEHYSRPDFPKNAPQFAISAKGDAVAILTFLPRRRLEVLVPDNKALNKSIWLDVAANVPDGTVQAVPTLLGVTDPGHFAVRWDMNGRSALQLFSMPPTATGAAPWRGIAWGPVVEDCPNVVAPNGHTAAVLGRNQITFVNTDGSAPPKPFLVASDTNLRLLGMSFSPDSSQVALLAVVSDLPTVMGFQVGSGDPVFTNLLSQTPVSKDAAPMPHALLWLAGAQVCLMNGNDLVDADTGKKFGALGVRDVVDAQVVGPSTVALTLKAPGGNRTVLAKLDDDKIRAAKPR